MNLRRLILSLYLVVFLGAAVAAGLFFWDSREEYNRLRRIELQNEQRLADAKEKLAAQERYLERLKTDPAFVEKRIQWRLHYVKPEDSVFLFEP